MANKNDYASMLYTLLIKAREIGERGPGSGEAFACYQIIDTAMSEAEAYGISLNEIGLEAFDPETLLANNRKAA